MTGRFYIASDQGERRAGGQVETDDRTKRSEKQIEKVCAERILLGEREGTDFMHTGYNLAFAGQPEQENL